MPSELQLQINGQTRILAVAAPTSLDLVVAELELRADRIALELNGEIVPRTAWANTPIQTGDRLEIVHFVGGGR
jgi:thiamine biosynthesis protein ThiS